MRNLSVTSSSIFVAAIYHLSHCLPTLHPRYETVSSYLQHQYRVVGSNSLEDLNHRYDINYNVDETPDADFLSVITNLIS